MATIEVQGVVVETLDATYNRKGSTSTPFLSLSDPVRITKCEIDGSPLSVDSNNRVYVDGVVLSHSKTYTVVLQFVKDTVVTLTYKLTISSDVPTKMLVHGSPVVTHDDLPFSYLDYSFMAFTGTVIMAFLVFAVKRR